MPRLGSWFVVGLGCVLGCVIAVTTSGCSTLGGGGEREIRRIAIIPFAYRGPNDSVVCTVCPDVGEVQETSREDALLVTAFFHEALTTYPRLSILPFEAVDRLLVPDMAESLERLQVAEDIDAVLVGTLVGLRPREGDPRNPSARGGASIYVALVDPLTENVLWVGTREGVQQPPPVTVGRVREMISGEPIRWHSDLGQAQVYAEQLVKEMVKSLR